MVVGTKNLLSKAGEIIKINNELIVTTELRYNVFEILGIKNYETVLIGCSNGIV